MAGDEIAEDSFQRRARRTGHARRHVSRQREPGAGKRSAGTGTTMNPLPWLYYRYIFLRENRLARAIESVVGRPEVPSQQRWESEYENGSWGRLRDLTEQAHNGVVLSYIDHLRPEGSVLEIGCGEGILLRRLRQIGYRDYTGIDISEVVIARCQQLSDSKTRFVACDAENYVPGSAHDVIVLNECIYYFVEPVATLQRYASYLKPGGVFVLSLFDSLRSRPIRRRLKESFFLLDETRISNAKGTWYCLVLNSAVASNPAERAKLTEHSQGVVSR
jgi:SAM-dependent methyltransferase